MNRLLLTKPIKIVLKPRMLVKTQPNCIDCKHSFMENGVPVCSLFYGTVSLNEYYLRYYLYAFECRKDNKLCGPDGFYFEKK
jgi:hypothetical protein